MSELPRGSRVSVALVALFAAAIGAALVGSLSSGPPAVALPPSIAVGPMTTTSPSSPPPGRGTTTTSGPPPSATAPHTITVVVVPTVRVEDDQGDVYDHTGSSQGPERTAHSHGDT